MQELTLEQVSSLQSSGSTSQLTVPTTIKDKPLLTPGTWNGLLFEGNEIEMAFRNTDWTNKKNYELIKDHADKPLSVDAWVGYVKNLRVKNGSLYGDLELWDEDIIRKLVHAKAKFGISAKVKGVENEGVFRKFTFANFSVVDDPACKEAYINLSDSSEEQITHTTLESAKAEDTNQEIDTEKDERGLDTQIMSEQETQKTEEKSFSVEELGSKIDLILSETKNLGASMEDLKTRVQALEDESSKEESKEEPESEPAKAEEPKEEPKEEAKEESSELAELKKEVAELKAKAKSLGKPKVVEAELSARQVGDPTRRHSRGTLEMSDILKNVVK